MLLVCPQQTTAPEVAPAEDEDDVSMSYCYRVSRCKIVFFPQSRSRLVEKSPEGVRCDPGGLVSDLSQCGGWILSLFSMPMSSPNTL